MPEETSSPSLLERLLAYASLTIIGAALLSFFSTLIIGLNDREAVAEEPWSIIFGVSLYALPVGFVLLIALLILSGRRRRAEFRRDSGR